MWSYTSGSWLYCISRQLWGFWVWWTFSKLCPKPQFCLGNIKIHLGFRDFFGWLVGFWRGLGFFLRKRKSTSIQLHCRLFGLESVATGNHCNKWFGIKDSDLSSLSDIAEIRFWIRLRMHRPDLKKCLYCSLKEDKY